jgi:hypothetical protein
MKIFDSIILILIVEILKVFSLKPKKPKQVFINTNKQLCRYGVTTMMIF